MTTLSPSTWPAWMKHTARLFGIGFVCGVAGYGVGWLLANHVFPDAGPLALDLRWSDAVAALAAACLILGAMITLLISLDPHRLGRLYKMEGAASPQEAAQARFQALTAGFSGVILLLPLIFSLTGVAPPLGLATVVVLLAIHTVMNVRVYRQADELLRRTVMEQAAITFFLGQGLLFIWAAAERLGFAPPITAWDIFAVLMTLYLVVSIIVSGRRGLPA